MGVKVAFYLPDSMSAIQNIFDFKSRNLKYKPLGEKLLLLVNLCFGLYVMNSNVIFSVVNSITLCIKQHYYLIIIIF